MSGIITIPLTAEDVVMAEFQAAQCAFGGQSQFRKEPAERAATMTDDNIVGQLGQIALHRYLFGHIERYVEGRYIQNKYPTVGDGGEDIVGCNIDVKTSLARYAQDAAKYHLIVRPKERHAGWVYIHALAPKDWRGNPRVVLTGWLMDEELPPEPETTGPFTGAYVMPVPELHPLMPIRYALLPGRM
jgi:hypothetical protein